MSSSIIPFKSGEKVVYYAHYSPGEEQNNKDRSVEEQINDIKKFCAENGLILDRSFTDLGVSGTSMKGRDGFFDIMAFLKQQPKPQVAGVIVWIFSRFSRNMETAQYYKADLRHL